MGRCTLLYSRAIIKKYSTPAAVVALAVVAFHALLLTKPWERYYLSYGAYTAVAASSAILITCVTFAPPRTLVKILEFPTIRWIGVISYGLYLWHPLVIGLSWLWVSTIVRYVASHIIAWQLSPTLRIDDVNAMLVSICARLSRYTRSSYR